MSSQPSSSVTSSSSAQTAPTSQATPALSSRALPRYSKIPASQYKKLPAKPNLEHLKGQAKALLKAYLAGERDALRRVKRFMPDAPPPHALPAPGEHRAPTLHLKDAQYVLAREHAAAWKFMSWEELKAHVDAVNNVTDELIVEQIGRLANWRHQKPQLLNPERFLGAVGMPLLPHLKHAIRHHPSPRVRQNCLGYLDHLDFPPDEDFIDTVVTAMNDPVPKIRRTAVHTLYCPRCKSVATDMKPEHVELMVRIALSDENEKVRIGACGVVEMLAKTRYGDAVRSILSDHARSRSELTQPRAVELLAKLAG
jgi:hypothetical protein